MKINATKQTCVIAVLVSFLITKKLEGRIVPGLFVRAF